VRVENGQLRGRLFLPPPESERQRELQGFVKAGVLRAVSVGFSADDVEPIKDSKKGGFRFLKQQLLECSLVGIPANPNALQVAKSLGASDETQRLVFDNGRSAATGNWRAGVFDPPRQQRTSQSVSLKAYPKMAKKSLAEQISALENARAAKAARMEEIQQNAADEDRTKDDAEREEFNGLDIEIESIDKELQDLRKLERAMMSTAKAAIGHNSQAAGESREPVRGQHVTFMQRQLPPGIPFARFVRCCVAAKGIPISALQIAEKQYPDMDDLHTVLRAAVSAGNTHADAFGANLIAYQVMASEFIEYLRPMTVIGRIPGLRRVPFNVRIPRQTAGASAYWVGEGQPKPVTNLAFDYILLRWTKLANIAVLTDEVIRFSNPAIDTLVRDDLAAAIVQQQDTDFLDPSNSGSTDVKPASITNGVTPVASSGATADDARADAVAVMNKFAAANIPAGGLVWVMNETTAMVLSAMLTALGVPYFPGITASGGTWMGFPVVTSQVAAAAGSPLVSNIVLLRPQDIFLADDGQVQIDVSNEASLQMLDNPTNASASGSPSAPTATSLVSLWQTNSTAVRAERFINWQKARSASVKYISGEAYAV
jgi:HK97 family phage major capsid protein